MVRIGTLPSRLLALDYGADLLYCEEIIDFKLIRCKRHVNMLLGTIDFIDDNQVVVFRTCQREKDKVILQLGTCNAERALEAALMVQDDVAGIDVNMGCPKDFSLKGGMGAALLSKPETVKDILSTLVKHLSIPVTCKMRLLPTMEDTLSLVKLIESTGVSAIAVHGRKKEERPRHANDNAAIKRICEAVSIPVIANGGSSQIESFGDIAKFKEETGASSVMIARASESNPSIFRKEGLLPLDQVIKEYIRYSVLYENHVKNIKYVIQHMLQSLQATEKGQKLLLAQEVDEIVSIWGMTDFYQEIKSQRKNVPAYVTGYDLVEERSVKRLKKTNDKENEEDSGDDCKLIECCVQFKRSYFPDPKLPKNVLHNYCKDKFDDKPVYHTVTVDKKFYCELTLGDHTFRSTFLEKNKMSAEQSAALLAGVFYRIWSPDTVPECFLEDPSFLVDAKIVHSKVVKTP